MGYLYYFYLAREAAGVGGSRVNLVTEAGIYDYAVTFDQPNHDTGFLCDDFGKVVAFHENVPYFIRKDDAKLVRALCLHIQGGAKRYIRKWIPADFGND